MGRFACDWCRRRDELVTVSAADLLKLGCAAPRLCRRCRAIKPATNRVAQSVEHEALRIRKMNEAARDSHTRSK